MKLAGWFGQGGPGGGPPASVTAQLPTQASSGGGCGGGSTLGVEPDHTDQAFAQLAPQRRRPRPEAPVPQADHGAALECQVPQHKRLYLKQSIGESSAGGGGGLGVRAAGDGGPDLLGVFQPPLPRAGLQPLVGEISQNAKTRPKKT